MKSDQFFVTYMKHLHGIDAKQSILHFKGKKTDIFKYKYGRWLKE